MQALARQRQCIEQYTWLSEPEEVSGTSTAARRRRLPTGGQPASAPERARGGDGAERALLGDTDCLDCRAGSAPRDVLQAHLAGVRGGTVGAAARHACLELLPWCARHGIAAGNAWQVPLPEGAGEKPREKRRKWCLMGDVHFDTAEARTEEGKRFLWVAMDRPLSSAPASGLTTQPGDWPTTFCSP